MIASGIQTGIPAVDWFLALLDELGYLIVFGFTVLENLFLIGSPTPGETVVVAAALVASRGGLILAGVWMSSFFGTIIGSNITYWLGRRMGIEVIEGFVARIAATRIGRILQVDDEAVAEVHEHFHTEGAKTVLISRFAIGAKNIVPAIAGATRMPAYWFELYTIIGAFIYTTLMCLIGWFLGENLDLALQVVRGIGYAGLAILVLFLTALWVVRRRIKERRRLADLLAEEAMAEIAEGASADAGVESADTGSADTPDASR